MPDTSISREELGRIAEQVARILNLQKLDDLTGEDAARIGCSSGVSTGCSSKSVGCQIGTKELTTAH